MPESYLVGDAVAEFLQGIGVDTAYGVISVHNIPMLDGIGRRNAIRFVMARGEAGAGHMADAHARVSGGLGVLFSSTGPGAANAVAGLVEGNFASVPVLHITGQTATGNMDKGQQTVHDVPDQLGMLKSVGKAAYRVRSAETAIPTLIRAAAEAMTPPRGPVSVEISIDIQRTEIARPTELDTALPVPSAPAPDPARMDRLVEMLGHARRPLLWLGNGARDAGAEVMRLVEAGLPVITSWQGRGVVAEDHPRSLGALAGLPEIEAFMESVDLLIVAGSRLKGHETRDMTMPLPEPRVHIDIDPAAEGRTYTSDLFITAEAGTALGAMADRLAGPLALAPGYHDDLLAAKTAAMENYLDRLGPYRDFPATLRAVMPRDAVFVRDVTISNSTWGHRLVALNGPRDSVYPVSAAIGPGLSLGVGAAIGAKGRKAVAMCGDGGFAVNMSEIFTAAQENADVVFMVMNDKGYGVIKHIQDALYGGRHFYGDLKGPDLEGLAKLAGMPLERASRATDLGACMERAFAVAGPALVEVDIEAIGPIPRYFQPPPHATRDED